MTAPTATPADRVTASPGRPSYSYDSHGNVTGFGTETIGYDANNHATTMYDGTTQIQQALSPSGRALTRYTYLLGAGAATSSTLYGYDGPGDSPSYSDPYLLGQLNQQVTTYVNGPGGLLLIDLAGAPTYPLANAHGDVVGTTDANGAFTANPATDAFGVGTPPANGLGWLGNDERFASSSSPDLIRMGVRIYDPTLGRFLEPDPVAGGSANDYDYCYADPINCSDLDGLKKPKPKQLSGAEQQILDKSPDGQTVPSEGGRRLTSDEKKLWNRANKKRIANEKFGQSRNIQKCGPRDIACTP